MVSRLMVDLATSGQQEVRSGKSAMQGLTSTTYQVHVDFSVSIGDRNSLGGPPGSAAHLPQCDKSHAWD